MINHKTLLIDQLTTMLKKRGYRKQKQTWNLNSEGVIVVFQVQNSQWDKDEYYLNCGIVIEALHPVGKFYSASTCDITERIPEKNQYGKLLDAELILSILEMWEQWYGTLPNLRQKALEGKLPKMSSWKAISYLTTLT